MIPLSHFFIRAVHFGRGWLRCTVLHAIRHGAAPSSLRDAISFRVRRCRVCRLIFCDWCDWLRFHGRWRCLYTWRRNNPWPIRTVQCALPACHADLPGLDAEHLPTEDLDIAMRRFG